MVRRKAKRGSTLPWMGDRERFIAEVPWDEHRRVLVFRRRYGGVEYVRLRTWNTHRESGKIYPTDRSYIIPAEHAEQLAEAIRAGALNDPLQDLPAWYVERDDQLQARYDYAVRHEAPECVRRSEAQRLRRRRMKGV